MKRLMTLMFLIPSLIVAAQDEEKVKDGGFKKENLFTGGSISLSFFNNAFLIGGNPVFGYSLTNWADAGIVVNYTYTSYRHYQYNNDKLKQTVYGGGGFVRLYPVRFLFAQAQWEHNWINLKYIPPPNTGMLEDKRKENANSILVGGGYTTGRDPEGKSAFGYLAVLFDITKDENSPYIDFGNNSLPIIRAGIQIPLFQGR